MRAMTFNEYMRGKSEAEIAAQIGGCTEHAVRKWRYGERRPDPDTMIRIEQITEGKVTLHDWARHEQVSARRRPAGPEAA